MSGTENKGLEEFTWNDNEDFFGIKDEKPEIEAIKEEVIETPKSKTKKEDEETIEVSEKKEDKKETKKEEKTDSKKEEVVEDNQKFFENTEEEDNTEKTITTSTDVKSLLKTGVFQFVEEKDLTEDDDLETVIEKEFDARLDVAIEEFAKDLDDEAKMFLKFKKAGGSTIEYLKTFEVDSFLEDIKEEDIKDDEKTQIKFLKKYYSEYEEMEDDEVDDKIEWLKERGKIEDVANKTFSKFNTAREEQRKNLVKRQKKAEEEAKERSRVYKEELKKTINETTEVGKIKIGKQDKEEMFDYLMKPTVKVGNSFVTPFQKDMQEVYKDKKLLLALAKIVKAKFDITDIKTTATTEVTKEIKKTLRAGSKEGVKKNLFDYFN